MSVQENKWIQGRLAAHRFPTGLIDGIMGPVTLEAIAAFQKANGLFVDSVVGPKTRKALAADPVVTPLEASELPDQAEETSRASKIIKPDPAVRNRWPTQDEVRNGGAYGKVGRSQTTIQLPYDMRLAWKPSQRLRVMSLHRKVAPSAVRVLQRVAELYSPAERSALGLDLFGGSLNVRKVRGGQTYSMHSWGIAIDFDPERNQLSWHRPRARLSHPDAVPFWQAWEAEGWLSLGRAKDYDWMHIQAARI